MNYKVLVVDDDQLTHRILGDYLKLAGYQVLHAGNGIECLELLRECQPDLVLLDVYMPELDGFQTLDRIRREETFSGIPILFLTGIDLPNLKVKGLEMGADDYITKPFNPGEILARVKIAIRRSQRFKRNNAFMSGDLATVSLAELLQTMEIGKRSCTITLPDIPARILLDHGVITRVEQGRFTGEEAMKRAIFLECGRFEVTTDNAEGELRDQTLPTTSLLISCLTYMDELKRMLGSDTKADCYIDALAESALSRGDLAKMLPIRLKNLICLLDGDLKRNCEAVLQGIDEGTVLTSGSAMA